MDAIEKEVRFAIVMYGGISLAIYMNGISQELLGLVNATSRSNGKRKEGATEAVYREIAQSMEEDRGGPVKFVVDVLAGTSAGGINAVFLSKALARGVTDLDSLERMWLNEGNIDKLLNDRGSKPGKYPSMSPKTSLLNSQRMYRKLLDAFKDMELGAHSPAEPLTDHIDLFVTATDLCGVEVPIKLGEEKIDETVYKHVFPFAYRRDESSNHFTGDYDPMLAFAARCTSSFPVAFEPTKLSDIRKMLTSTREVETFDDSYDKWKNLFFSPYEAAKDETPVGERAFADGGYLDNRPFGHAIRAIHERHATGPVDRKLLFIDPFTEEILDKEKKPREISFIENLELGAMTLPRYEPIREEINDVNKRNRWLHRVNVVMENTQKVIGSPKATAKSEVKVPLDSKKKDPKAYKNLWLKDVLDTYGPAYASYHLTKIYSVTDDIALMLTRAAGIDDRYDLLLAVRELVKRWRLDNYRAKRSENKGDHKTESQFLLHYDLGYRIRRLHHLRKLIELALEKNREEDQKKLPSSLRNLEGEDRKFLIDIHGVFKESLGVLYRLRDRLLLRGKDNPLFNSVKNLIDVVDRGDKKMSEILDSIIDTQDDSVVKNIYGDHSTLFEPVLEDLSTIIRGTTDEPVKEEKSGTLLAHLLVQRTLEQGTGNSDIKKDLWDLFRYEYEKYDSYIFPLLAGGNYGEGSKIITHRVSPIDAINIQNSKEAKNGDPERRKNKLAGVAVGAFGGFLDRQWRHNDIMWGRLDGAERIISSLVPGNAPKVIEKRKEFTDKAHQAILEDYLGKWCEEIESMRGLSERDEKQKEILLGLKKQLDETGWDNWKSVFKRKYSVDTSVEPAPNLTRIGRSAKIMSSMIDRLKERGEKKGRFSKLLGQVGWFVMNVVDFTTPKSLKKAVADYWIQLLLLSASLIILGGIFIKPFKSMLLPGAILLTTVLASWYVKRKIETRIHNNPLSFWCRILKGIVIGSLVIAISTVLIVLLTSLPDFWIYFKTHLAELFSHLTEKSL